MSISPVRHNIYLILEKVFKPDGGLFLTFSSSWKSMASWTPNVPIPPSGPKLDIVAGWRHRHETGVFIIMILPSQHIIKWVRLLQSPPNSIQQHIFIRLRRISSACLFGKSLTFERSALQLCTAVSKHRPQD